jgi:hypothetical protein
MPNTAAPNPPPTAPPITAVLLLFLTGVGVGPADVVVSECDEKDVEVTVVLLVTMVVLGPSGLMVAGCVTEVGATEVTGTGVGVAPAGTGVGLPTAKTVRVQQHDRVQRSYHQWDLFHKMLLVRYHI